MKSVDELRGYDASLGDLERRLSAITGCGFIGDALNVIADEIEREIAERYQLLPLDADGVPIHIGDTVREVDDRVPMKVMSLTFYEDCVDVNTCGMNPKLLRHVKPRTLEDIVKDAIEYGHGIYPPTHCYDAKVSELCAEIRELMGGDAR